MIDGGTTGPQGPTLWHAFAHWAHGTPERPALLHRGITTSYGALHAEALELAAALVTAGVTHGSTVGLALPRDARLVATVLAVLACGAAYLPLDPDYPQARLAFYAADAAVPVIVTTAALADRFALPGARLLRIDDLPAPAAGAPDLHPPVAESRAYLLYTSGSTGQPKGVGVTHANVLALVRWAGDTLDPEDLSGLLFSTSLNFDLSAFELFVPLCLGGCIVVAETLFALANSPDAAAVRLINTGPTLLDAFVRAHRLPDDVRTAIVAGEKLLRPVADRIFAAAPGLRLLNCYGPTEATVYATWAQIARDDDQPPLIGQALGETRAHVLDRNGVPVPDGTAGELFIGGPQVAPGYHARPDLTAERFLPDRFAGHGLLYRTGDIVLRRADGQLEFHGRADDQIKINGVRIEPGEIEAVLEAAGAPRAIVGQRADREGTRRLVAWLLDPHLDARGQADTGSLRTALAQALPPMMWPAAWVQVERLPMTPSGKVDRAALPDPDWAPRQREDRPPEGEAERAVAECWEQVLGHPPAGAYADFLDAGGDSLGFLNLLAALEARFGVEIAPEALVHEAVANGLCVAGLVRVIDDLSASAVPGLTLVALNPQARGRALYLFPGVSGDALQFRSLGRAADRTLRLCAFHCDPREGLFGSLEELAAAAVRLIVSDQPEGAILLGGYSFGALTAWEMARQLAAAGREVGRFVVLDSRWPYWQARVARWPAIALRFWRNIARSNRALSLLKQAWRRAPAPYAQTGGAHQGRLGQRRATIAAHHRLYDDHLATRPHAARTTVPVLVARAAKQPLRMADAGALMGWEAATTGPIDCLAIPGDHVSAIQSVGATTLAKGLCAALGEAPAPVPAPVSPAP